MASSAVPGSSKFRFLQEQPSAPPPLLPKNIIGASSAAAPSGSSTGPAERQPADCGSGNRFRPVLLPSSSSSSSSLSATAPSRPVLSTADFEAITALTEQPPFQPAPERPVKQQQQPQPAFYTFALAPKRTSPTGPTGPMPLQAVNPAKADNNSNGSIPKPTRAAHPTKRGGSPGRLSYVQKQAASRCHWGVFEVKPQAPTIVKPRPAPTAQTQTQPQAQNEGFAPMEQRQATQPPQQQPQQQLQQQPQQQQQNQFMAPHSQPHSQPQTRQTLQTQSQQVQPTLPQTAPNPTDALLATTDLPDASTEAGLPFDLLGNFDLAAQPESAVHSDLDFDFGLGLSMNSDGLPSAASLGLDFDTLESDLGLDGFGISQGGPELDMPLWSDFGLPSDGIDLMSVLQSSQQPAALPEISITAAQTSRTLTATAATTTNPFAQQEFKLGEAEPLEASANTVLPADLLMDPFVEAGSADSTTAPTTNSSAARLDGPLPPSSPIQLASNGFTPPVGLHSSPAKSIFSVCSHSSGSMTQSPSKRPISRPRPLSLHVSPSRLNRSSDGKRIDQNGFSAPKSAAAHSGTSTLPPISETPRTGRRMSRPVRLVVDGNGRAGLEDRAGEVVGDSSSSSESEPETDDDVFGAPSAALHSGRPDFVLSSPWKGGSGLGRSISCRSTRVRDSYSSRHNVHSRKRAKGSVSHPNPATVGVGSSILFATGAVTPRRAKSARRVPGGGEDEALAALREVRQRNRMRQQQRQSQTQQQVLHYISQTQQQPHQLFPADGHAEPAGLDKSGRWPLSMAGGQAGFSGFDSADRRSSPVSASAFMHPHLPGLNGQFGVVDGRAAPQHSLLPLDAMGGLGQFDACVSSAGMIGPSSAVACFDPFATPLGGEQAQRMVDVEGGQVQALFGHHQAQAQQQSQQAQQQQQQQPRHFTSMPVVDCICGRTSTLPSEPVMDCRGCGRLMHAECCQRGPMDGEEVEFGCPFCDVE